MEHRGFAVFFFPKKTKKKTQKKNLAGAQEGRGLPVPLARRTRGGNLSPHCRAANVDLGDKTRSKNSRASPRRTRIDRRSTVGQSYFFLEKNRWGGGF